MRTFVRAWLVSVLAIAAGTALCVKLAVTLVPGAPGLLSGHGFDGLYAAAVGLLLGGVAGPVLALWGVESSSGRRPEPVPLLFAGLAAVFGLLAVVVLALVLKWPEAPHRLAHFFAAAALVAVFPAGGFAVGGQALRRRT